MQANTNENDYYDARILGEIPPRSQRLMADDGVFATRSRLFMIANNKITLKGLGNKKTESALPLKGSFFHTESADKQQ
ncbi:hypothetical protein HS962_13430 [Pantoea sp. BIGb0393]|uniref:Uncharacterized protein n=1 Tax=Pantoea nemavictus TaxID=2726955 RepID=A0ABU8PU07_9GAMM|nr:MULTISPECIES: hypothetical protein [Pantoea]MBA0037210.1 hypothetical protein [Pantoea nemavictus]